MGVKKLLRSLQSENLKCGVSLCNVVISFPNAGPPKSLLQATIRRLLRGLQLAKCQSQH